MSWPTWGTFAAILFLAALIRAAALYAASVLPSFSHYRLDALLYRDAGLAVASGDLSLGDGVLHMSPLYSYFVGAVYWIFGTGDWAVRGVQLVLGVATVGLIYGAAARLLSRGWAIAAGLLAALYGPFVFYESQLLLAAPLSFLHALLIWLTVGALGEPSARVRTWAWIGFVWGLAALARPTALLYALPLGYALWVSTRGMARRARFARALVMGGAFAATIAPVTVRNAVVGGELVLVTDSGGLNFFLGNGPGAIGTFRIPPEMPDAASAQAQFEVARRVAESELGYALSSREVNAYWYARTFDEIRARPGRWSRLLLEKAWLFWNARELPNTADYSFNRQINPVLALPLVQFWWLSPFALLGGVLFAASGRRQESFLALLIATQLAAMVAFFVLAHYRLPAVPGLLLASLGAAHWLAQRWRERAFQGLAFGGVALAIGTALTFAPKLPKPFDDEYFKLGYAYHVQGDLAGAEAAYLEALSIRQDNISAHKNLARLYESAGDLSLAHEHWSFVASIAAKRGQEQYRSQAAYELRRLESALAPPP